MNPAPPKIPSLQPTFIPAPAETSRVMPNVPSPTPHLGWHSRGYLPHWDHPGMIQSLNFRLGDSLPRHVLERWKSELARRSETEGAVELRRCVEEYLDAGRGECLLTNPEFASLTEQALLHFDSERYRLLAWCVMPNHVHVLIEASLGVPLGKILQSWKSYTCHEMNKALRRTGSRWQREYLDRYVRNAEHYTNVIAYIENNPVKAGLVQRRAEWCYSSAKYRDTAPSQTEAQAHR